MCTSPVVLPDSENMGVDVGISLLSRLQAKIRLLTFREPPSWIFHFRLPTYLLISSAEHRSMFVSENTRIAVAILFLASVELKIHCMLCAFHLQLLVLPVLSRHIGYLVGARRVLFAPSCSPAIFRKSRLSPSSYEIAA